MVLAAVRSEHLQPIRAQLHALAGHHRLALGDGAVENGALDGAGVLELTGDPIAEAERVTTLVRGGDEAV